MRFYIKPLATPINHSFKPILGTKFTKPTLSPFLVKSSVNSTLNPHKVSFKLLYYSTFSMSSEFFDHIKDIKLKSAVDGSEVLATDLWKEKKTVVTLFRRLG